MESQSLSELITLSDVISASVTLVRAAEALQW